MYGGVSQGMIDVSSNFATNINYAYREGRRRTERKRIADKASLSSDISVSPKKTKRQKVSHDKTKEQHIQVAKDIIHCAKKYSPERIKLLPKKVQQQASIGTISANGFGYVENNLTLEKMKHAMSRKASSKVKKKTFDDYMKIAENSIVDNDCTFKSVSIEQKERKEDIMRYGNYNFWNTLNVRDGFKLQLKQILLGF